MKIQNLLRMLKAKSVLGHDFANYPRVVVFRLFACFLPCVRTCLRGLTRAAPVHEDTHIDAAGLRATQG